MTTKGFLKSQQDGMVNNPLLNTNAELNDVLPEPVEVTLIWYEEAPHSTPDFPVRLPRTRKALINTYVPMRVLHSMMASQNRIQKLQQMGQRQMTETDQTEMLDWMVEQVLKVWQLTEPSMTADALKDGLSFQKIYTLFNRFFGSLLNTTPPTM